MKNSTRRDRVTRWLVAATLCVGLGLSPAWAEESISSKVLTLVSKMTVEQQQALYDFLTKFSAPGGAAASTAPDPQKSLTENIKKLKDAAVKGDLDALTGVLADDFQQSQLGGKDAFKAFVGTLIASGQLSSYAAETTISADRATFKRTGDTVSVDPIEVSGSWGSASLSLTAKLVNNEWKVTGAEVH